MIGSGECPLRLTCMNEGACPQTSISFDTLDGYPSVDFEGKTVSLVDSPRHAGVFPEPTQGGIPLYELNEDAADRPLPICNAQGAARDALNELSPADQARLDALAVAIKNNTWRGSLTEAVADFPNAPWADAFRAEAASTSTHPKAEALALPIRYDSGPVARGLLAVLGIRPWKFLERKD